MKGRVPKERSALARVCQRSTVIVLVFLAAGCTHNPMLGIWSISNREKEVPAAYLDELTTNIQKPTGATQIEFRKHSIVITGPGAQHRETGVKYSIRELEGGAIDVRILQPRKGDTTRDIDVCHVAASGNSARLESPTEVVDLVRIEKPHS